MKKSETYIWISLFLAAAFFFITWLLLQWNFAVSALLSAGIYVAMTMLIKPVRKIGNVNLEIMPEGKRWGGSWRKPGKILKASGYPWILLRIRN